VCYDNAMNIQGLHESIKKDIECCGFVYAKFLVDFVRAVDTGAVYSDNVQLLLRDARMFNATRNELGKLGVMDVRKPWNEVHLNRETAKLAFRKSNRNCNRYFEESGVYADATLVDTGFMGTLSERVKEHAEILGGGTQLAFKTQTILASGSPSFHANVKGPDCFSFVEGGEYGEALLSQGFENTQIIMETFEGFPHKHERFNGLAFMEDGGKIVPYLTENMNPFAEFAEEMFEVGLVDGISDYVNSGMCADLKKYVKLMATNAAAMYEMFRHEEPLADRDNFRDQVREVYLGV